MNINTPTTFKVLVGDTVRIRTTFKNFEGVVTDATSIQVKIYNARKEAVGEPVTLVSNDRVSIGVYDYYYIIPDLGNLICEVSGIVATRTNISRVTMLVQFIP